MYILGYHRDMENPDPDLEIYFKDSILPFLHETNEEDGRKLDFMNSRVITLNVFVWATGLLEAHGCTIPNSLSKYIENPENQELEELKEEKEDIDDTTFELNDTFFIFLPLASTDKC